MQKTRSSGKLAAVEAAMYYQELAPADGLATEVECWWRFHLEPGEPPCIDHVVVPDGAVSMCVAFAVDPSAADQGAVDQGAADQRAEVSVVGPFCKARRLQVRQGVVYVGARLRPGSTLLPPGVETTLVDRVADSAELDPAFVRWLPLALAGLKQGDTRSAESAFADWPFARQASDARVQYAVARLAAAHGNLRIEVLAREAGLSPRQLQRRFRSVTGLSPKVYARLRKLRHACILSLHEQQGLAPVSAASGYCDQAHLGNEISALFHQPAGTVASYLRRISHAFPVSEISKTHDPE